MFKSEMPNEREKVLIRGSLQALQRHNGRGDYVRWREIAPVRVEPYSAAFEPCKVDPVPTHTVHAKPYYFHHRIGGKAQLCPHGGCQSDMWATLIEPADPDLEPFYLNRHSGRILRPID